MDRNIHEVLQDDEIKTAHDLFSELQTYRGRASLDGFINGEVIYRSPEPRRIQVIRLPIDDDFEHDLMTSRGFDDEDIKSGIVTLIESEFRNPDWPSGTFIREPNLRYYNVSGTGKVFYSNYEGGDDSFHEGTLSPTLVDALKTVVRLSFIPKEVYDKFGTYERFIKALGDDYKYQGIDSSEHTPTQILYNGTLRQFVTALQMREEGTLGELNSAHHHLVDSLDDRSHFEKMFELLEKAEGV